MTTAAAARNLAASISDAVATVVATRAVAEVNRETVDAIKVRILSETEWLDDEGNRVTEPKCDWLIEGNWAEYNALVDVAVRAAGYSPPEGYCPALMAETKLSAAEDALIEAARVFPQFSHVTSHRLMCSTTKDRCGLAMRAEYVDLLIKMAFAAQRAA